MAQKPFMTREQFLKETLLRSRKCLVPSVQAQYWNILGKALGYIDADNQTNIAIFKDITIEALKFIDDSKARGALLPVESVSVIPQVVGT